MPDTLQPFCSSYPRLGILWKLLASTFQTTSQVHQMIGNYGSLSMTCKCLRVAFAEFVRIRQNSMVLRCWTFWPWFGAAWAGEAFHAFRFFLINGGRGKRLLAIHARAPWTDHSLGTFARANPPWKVNVTFPVIRNLSNHESADWC